MFFIISLWFDSDLCYPNCNKKLLLKSAKILSFLPKRSAAIYRKKAGNCEWEQYLLEHFTAEMRTRRVSALYIRIEDCVPARTLQLLKSLLSSGPVGWLALWRAALRPISTYLIQMGWRHNNSRYYLLLLLRGGGQRGSHLSLVVTRLVTRDPPKYQVPSSLLIIDNLHRGIQDPSALICRAKSLFKRLSN
jgi:hypothetical protein